MRMTMIWTRMQHHPQFKAFKSISQNQYNSSSNLLCKCCNQKQWSKSHYNLRHNQRNSNRDQYFSLQMQLMMNSRCLKRLKIALNKASRNYCSTLNNRSSASTKLILKLSSQQWSSKTRAHCSKELKRKKLQNETKFQS